MKVLCFIDSLISGGAQRQLVELAKALKERGYSVKVLIYHNKNFFKSELDDFGIEVVLKEERSYLKRVFKIRRYIRKGNFDVVISFLQGPNFIAEISGLPIKDWKLIVGERSANPNILKSFKLYFLRSFHLLADYVVANSIENIKIVQRVNRLLPESKTKVIYNMVDFDRWVENKSYYIRHNGTKRMVVVARHEPLKNLEGLVSAVSMLSELEIQNLVIDWFGDEKNNSSLKDAKRRINELKLNNVFNFYPATLGIVDEMNKAHAIGLFSYYEGFPNAICEAMALGKAVICTRVSDIPLFLGNSKLLCEPDDVISMRDAIRTFLSYTNQQLYEIGQHNKVIVKSSFSKESIVSQYITLF